MGVDDAVDMQEWELDMLKRDDPQKDDVQEGSPNKEEGFKTVEALVGTFKVDRLKAIARQFALPISGNKPVIFERIQDCDNSSITMINTNKFLYKKEKEGNARCASLDYSHHQEGATHRRYWHGNCYTAQIFWLNKPRECERCNKVQLLHVEVCLSSEAI